MNLSMFFIMSMLMSSLLVMMILTMTFSQKFMSEKKTQFECGFNVMSKNKSSFSTKFFLIMILFLVFDLEISILLPSNVLSESFKMSNIPPILFILFITIAMLSEWINGIIEWTK